MIAPGTAARRPDARARARSATLLARLGASIERRAVLRALPRAAALLACLAASPIAAQPVLELTLEEAVALALRANRTVVTARERRVIDALALEASEERYAPKAELSSRISHDDEGRTHADIGFGPTLRIASGADVRMRLSEPLGENGQRDPSWTLSVRQPLMRGFGAEVDTAPVRLARLREARNALAFRDTLSSTVASVIAAYRSLIRSQRALRIAEQSLERSRRQIETNQALIEAGEMAPREIIPTQAELANRELALAEREHALGHANSALVAVLDVDSSARIEPTGTLDARACARASREEALALAYAQRSDMRRAAIESEEAQIELVRARDARRWDLDLEASVHGERTSDARYNVALSLSVPFGDSAPDVELARARNAVRDVARDALERRESVAIEVGRAYEAVEIGERRVTLAERALDLSRAKLDLEQEKLAAGLTSTVQLSSVENDLISAETRSLDATIAYLNALTRLDQATGTLLERWSKGGARMACAPPAPESP